MEIKVRKMIESDYQDIKQYVFCDTPIEVIKDNVKNNVANMEEGITNWLYYVAEYDNKIVGTMYVEFKESSVSKHIASLYSVVVAEAYRGKGICRAMFETVIKEIKDKNIELITLSVRGGTPAEIVYQKLGFTKYGWLPKGIKDKNKYFDSVYYYYDLKQK